MRRASGSNKAFVPGVIVCAVLVGFLLFAGLALLVPWQSKRARKRKGDTPALTQHAADPGGGLEALSAAGGDSAAPGGPASAESRLSLQQSWHAARSATFPSSQVRLPP